MRWIFSICRKLSSIFLLSLALLFITMRCDKVDAQPKVGASAPSLNIEKFLQAPQGEKSWNSFKGQAVLLEFWATWCGPCIAKIPHLNKLIRANKNKPIKFISITNQSRATVQSFLDDRPMQGWIGLDTDNSMFSAYHVRAIPKTFLVYPNGKIAAITQADKVTQQTIDHLMASKKIAIADHSNQPSGDALFDQSNHASVQIKVKSDQTNHSENYSLNTSEGKLEAKSIRVGNALRLAHNIPETRMKGSENILNQLIAVKTNLPSGGVENFRTKLSQALDSTLHLRTYHKKKEAKVLILTAPHKQNGLRISKSFSSHSSATSEGALAASNATMDDLTGSIEFILKKPVINQTNLKKNYDWTVEFDKKNPKSLIQAVENRLNLKLTSSKRKIDFLFVETKY